MNMKLFVVLALCALSFASSRIPEPRWLDNQITETQIHDTEFRAGREYRFVYNGQLATGIPGSSDQHAATRIQSIVSLIFKSHNDCVLKIQDIRMGKLNEHMPNPRNIQPFSAFEQVEIEQRLKEKLLAPVHFSYRQGMIHDIVFDGTEQPWSANIKRGILNLLQVNIGKQRRTDTAEEILIQGDLTHQNENRDNDFFTVMENTIEGECETSYTVTSQPSRFARVDRPVLNVTKSINFEKCQRRPETKYNYRFQDWCPTCEQRYNAEEHVLRSSTVAKYNMTVSDSRESFLIESAIVESHYTYVPFNEEGNVIATYVNQTLVLVKTGQIESQIRELTNPKPSDSHLIYTPDWDIMKEKFFMEGQNDFQTETPYSEIKDKIEFVKRILKKLTHYMVQSVEEEAPRQFTRLVKVLRMMKREEIDRVHELVFRNVPEGFTQEEHKKIRSLLPDAVAMCGTKDCVEHLIHDIKEHQFKSFKAASLIRKLISIRVVSQEIIEKLWIFSEHEVCQRSPMIKQSVYLTVGSLINALCSENEDTLAIEFKLKSEKLCPRQLKEKFVERLIAKYRQSRDMYEKVLCLKTIGNAGIDLSIYELEKIIKNPMYSTVERMEAILALRQLKDIMPRKIQKVLMPVYMNKLELPSVRMVAFHYIMKCLPEKQVLDQISRSLFSEKNQQVASFVYTKLHTLANSTHPCEKRMAEELKLSLRHSRYLPVSSWLSYSKFLRTETYSDKHKMGLALDFVNIMSNESMLPKHFATSLHGSFGGMWMKYLANFGFTQHGIDRVLRRFLREKSSYFQTSLNDLLSGEFQMPNPRFNYREEIRNIFQQLNTVDRQMYESTSEPFGTVYMKFMDQEFGFLPLSREIIPEEVIEFLSKDELSISQLVKRAERFLNDVSLPFDVTTATLLHEMSRKIPTTIGLPLQFSVKVPTVFQANGRIKVEFDKQNPLRKVKLVLKDFKPSFVSTLVTKVESWSPIVNTGLKVVAQIKLYAPFDGYMSIDTKKSPVEVKFAWEPKEQHNNYELISVQTRPITTSIVWPRSLQQWQEPEEKTIHGEEWTRVQEYDTTFGEQALGVKFHLRSRWHQTPVYRVPSTPFSPLSGPNKLVIRVEPGYEMPKEIVLTLSGKLFESTERMVMQPNFDRFFEAENQDNFLERPDNEYYRKYQSSSNTKHGLNIHVETKGSSIKREAKLTTDCYCDEDVKTCKCKLAVERSPIPMRESGSESWKFVCELETLFPESPYTVNEITNDKKFLARINAKWGSAGNMDKYCNVKIVGDRSERQKDLMERSTFKRMYDNEEQRNQYRSLFSPVAQFEHVVKYGKLNEYKIDVDYKMNPWAQNMTQKMYRLLKSKYYWHADVNEVEIRNPENRLRAKLTIDPENLRYVNLTVKTPREETHIKDIPLWTQFEPLNLRINSPSRTVSHMFSQYVSDNTYPICEVRSDRVNTFDDAEYRVPITTCYTVLAKDCDSASHSKFAVLIKKQSEESEKKTLKIVTQNAKLIIRAHSSEDIECELNGEVKQCNEIDEVRESSRVFINCDKQGPYIRCELPEAGLRVYFDGYSANVKVSPVYRNQVCGICGHYDMEQDNEYFTPRNERLNEHETSRMYQSYMVRDNECSLDESIFSQSEKFEYRPLSWEDEKFDDFKESYENSVHKNQEWEVEPIERTKVIEQGHEICFSKQPVLRCPKNTYPLTYKTEQVKIVYTCLNRSDIQTETYLRLAARDIVVPEMANMAASFTETEIIPKTCRQY